MATNWVFLHGDDTLPATDGERRSTLVGPKVTATTSYALASPEAGKKGLLSASKVWDAFGLSLGAKVCRVTATGVAKGPFYLSPSVGVTHQADLTSQIHTLAVNRCLMNPIRYSFQAGHYRNKMDNAIQAKRDYLAGQITAERLEEILTIARALPYRQCRNAVLDACRADVGGAKSGSLWITGYLRDRATIEPVFLATVNAAVGL